MKTKKNYKPDPDMSLTKQAEIYHGKQYIANNPRGSILHEVKRLGWPLVRTSTKKTKI